MKLHQFEQIDPDHKSSRVTIDAAWQRAVADAVDPQNAVQAAALHYATATGVVPLVLPTGAKSHPQSGLTGYTVIPEPAVVIEQIDAMTDTSNIGIRLPAGIIGIDVDTYGHKNGHRALSKLESVLGALPPTWSSSRREFNPDHRSAIYFYRLAPAQLRWFTARNTFPRFASEVCRDVETIQLTHRYAVVGPSTVDGLIYTWYRPDGSTEPALMPPDFSTLPTLPRAWAARLLIKPNTRAIRSLKATRVPGESYAAPDYTEDAERADQWCNDHITGWNDAPDAFMQDQLDQALLNFTHSPSRYIALRDAVWRMLHLAVGDERYPGHPGGSAAIDQLTNTYLASKPEPKAVGEAARIFATAVDRISERIGTGDLQPLSHTDYRFYRGN